MNTNSKAAVWFAVALLPLLGGPLARAAIRIKRFTGFVCDSGEYDSRGFAAGRVGFGQYR